MYCILKQGLSHHVDSSAVHASVGYLRPEENGELHVVVSKCTPAFYSMQISICPFAVGWPLFYLEQTYMHTYMAGTTRCCNSCLSVCGCTGWLCVTSKLFLFLLETQWWSLVGRVSNSKHKQTFWSPSCQYYGYVVSYCLYFLPSLDDSSIF